MILHSFICRRIQITKSLISSAKTNAPPWPNDRSPQPEKSWLENPPGSHWEIPLGNQLGMCNTDPMGLAIIAWNVIPFISAIAWNYSGSKWSKPKCISCIGSAPDQVLGFPIHFPRGGFNPEKDESVGFQGLNLYIYTYYMYIMYYIYILYYVYIYIHVKPPTNQFFEDPSKAWTTVMPQIQATSSHFLAAKRTQFFSGDSQLVDYDNAQYVKGTISINGTINGTITINNIMIIIMVL